MSLATLCVLNTNLPTMPEEVELVRDFGPTTIVISSEKQIVSGNHIMIKGEENAIKDWFHEAGQVWVGKGPPMLEQFELWEYS